MEQRKPLNIEIQEINRSRIYKLLLDGESSAKKDIVQQLHLCLPTVTKNIERLIKDGLIKKAGSKGHTGGRRAVTYTIAGDAKIAFGVDITRNHVTIVAVNLYGKIMSSVRHRIAFEPSKAYYKKIADEIKSEIKKSKFKTNKILGVGIGIPALVDKNKKNILYSKIIDLAPNTHELFAGYLPYDIQLFNDANAAAFAESRICKNMKNVLYLMLSNNIGGAMIINDEVYSGDTQKSSEVGHIPLFPKGKKCYCGQRGCVDAYLAASILSDLTDGNLKLFFAGLAEGNKVLEKKWDEYLDNLASTVNIINVILDCNVILGGNIG